MQRGNTDLERSTFTAEIVRQISLHSTILAGAALISLTSVTFPQSSNASLQNAFGVAMSVAAGCHLVALFAAGVLTFVSRIRPIEPNYEGSFHTAWYSYLAGLAALVVALGILPWITIPAAAVPITGVAVVAGLAMICTLYRVGSTAERDAPEQSHALEPAAESVSNRESSPPAQ